MLFDNPEGQLDGQVGRGQGSRGQGSGDRRLCLDPLLATEGGGTWGWGWGGGVARL